MVSSIVCTSKLYGSDRGISSIIMLIEVTQSRNQTSTGCTRVLGVDLIFKLKLVYVDLVDAEVLPPCLELDLNKLEDSRHRGSICRQ